MADPNIRIKRSAVTGKQPTVEQLPLGELALNTYDAELFARRERAGIGTDIVRLGAGATVASDEALDIAKASLTDQTTNTAQRAKEALKGLLEIGRLVLTNDKYALV